MEIVQAEFMRFDEVALSSLIGAMGVYVLWDGKSRVQPSYIGEGAILERLAQHAKRFAWPLDGYVAVMGDWSTLRTKRQAEVVEAVLLLVAGDTNRTPVHNDAAGKLTAVRTLLRGHRRLRVKVIGRDPLQSPWRSQRLAGSKWATFTVERGHADYMLDHEWHRRRATR